MVHSVIEPQIKPHPFSFWLGGKGHPPLWLTVEQLVEKPEVPQGPCYCSSGFIVQTMDSPLGVIKISWL